MTPLPKRRHSSARQGKREQANLKKTLSVVQMCPKCGKVKKSHQICPHCGFYK